MRDLAERVCFAVQREQEGYGHAVYQTKAFAGGEMVLLCLGDHLFRGKTVSPFRGIGGMAAVSGGQERFGRQPHRAGGIERLSAPLPGKRRRGQSTSDRCFPHHREAGCGDGAKVLRVDGLEDDVFLGWFGMHLLAPCIYDVLEK